MTDSGDDGPVPRDPDYRARVQASFGRQRVMRTLGVVIVDEAPGRVELELPYRPEFTQQHGFMHAGILATALDTACGYAAFSLMPPDTGVLTVEFKVNLLAPARGERFRITAHVVKPGRTLSVCDAQAHAFTGDAVKLVATMTATIMTIAGRDDVRE